MKKAINKDTFIYKSGPRPWNTLNFLLLDPSKLAYTGIEHILDGANRDGTRAAGGSSKSLIT